MGNKCLNYYSYQFTTEIIQNSNNSKVKNYKSTNLGM